jgi:hypothetical protein
MDILEWLNDLPAAARTPWYGLAAGVLVAMLLGLWLEGRWFSRGGRAGSWGVVRMVSLFAAALTLLSVWGPVRAVSGPVALLVFYVAVLTVAPLIWFGAHLFVGPRLKPAFSGGESLVLALSGLALLALPATAWMFARDALLAQVRSQGNTPLVDTSTAPMAHGVHALARWQLPSQGELWTLSLRAPPDVRLERVQRFATGQWHDTSDTSQPDFCLHGQDLHLAWLGRAPAPVFRLHWTDTAGRAQRSVYTPDTAALQGIATQPFTVAFREDGFDLPIPMARHLAHQARGRSTEGKWQHVALNNITEPRTHPRDNCLMPGRSQPPTAAQPTIQAVGLMIGPSGQLPVFVEFERPAPAN